MPRSLAAVLAAVAIVIAAIAAFALPTVAPAQDRGRQAAHEAREVERAVGDYLRKNPEILLEAMRALEEKERNAKANVARDAIAQNRVALEDGGSPVLGNPAGKTAVIEFFDYQCPYCKRVIPDLMAMLKADGEMRIVMKELPILGPESVVAAKAALAAREQGKYEAMHLALMGERSRLSEGSVLAIAKAVGLDVDRLRRDMESPAVREELQKNLALARAIGVDGTPAFVVGDRLVPGADMESLRKLIAAARGG
jgi:protein-disulfide isomerase